MCYTGRVGETSRTYCCIDLKSFYASVECVDRKWDPFEKNLVVRVDTAKIVMQYLGKGSETERTYNVTIVP